MCQLLPLLFEELLKLGHSAEGFAASDLSSVESRKRKLLEVINLALTRLRGCSTIPVPLKGLVETWRSQSESYWTSGNGTLARHLFPIFIQIGSEVNWVTLSKAFLLSLLCCPSSRYLDIVEPSICQYLFVPHQQPCCVLCPSQSPALSAQTLSL